MVLCKTLVNRQSLYSSLGYCKRYLKSINHRMSGDRKRTLTKNKTKNVTNIADVPNISGTTDVGENSETSSSRSKYFKIGSDTFSVEILDSKNDNLGLEEGESGGVLADSASREVVKDSAHGNAPASSKKLGRSFYEKSCEDLAKSLLGRVLVRRLKDGKFLRGKIVETESYPGAEDTASHSHKGKRTPRNEAMFMTPGTAYVYSIHTYVCFNISSQGNGAAVLLRALEPLCGLETMRTLRGRRRSDAGNNLKEKEFTNGPSKFTEALNITKEEVNKLDLTDNDFLWIENGDTINESEIVKCARININCDQEWKEAKLRFYIKGNKYVSVRNKAAEKLMDS